MSYTGSIDNNNNKTLRLDCRDITQVCQEGQVKEESEMWLIPTVNSNKQIAILKKKHLQITLYQEDHVFNIICNNM